MFCQNCGAQVQPGQSYCGACAKPLSGYGGALPGRLRRHVDLLGIFWIVYSVFSLIGGVALMIVAHALFRPSSRFETGAPAFLYPLLSAVGAFLLVKAIAGIAAGYGLLQHEGWARVLVLVLGFLDLLHVPLGTVLGIYTIWVLLSPGADSEYRSLPQAA